jgi:enoyl-CoA hydratase/carnithine racemase
MSCKQAWEGRVLRVTLARPDKRNALTAEMCQAIVDAVEQAPGAVLIDAEGDVFCAGMDLESASAETTAIHASLFSIGARATTPVVCAVQGPALGGGVGLIANAHVAVAAHGTQFGLTEIRVGMWPYVIWPSVVSAIGERRARGLALMGNVFGINEAMDWQLIHESVPAVELEDRATAIAHALAESSRSTIVAGLDFANRARSLTLDQTLELALATRAHTFASEDFAEGIAAFREKRRPQWPSLR